uniref:left-right determination factor 2-like n=1 Tax=Styela clava TaxID=7725 RepID=UPI001939B12B|nr:left-right determination factor 2-like [Styela clava]
MNICVARKHFDFKHFWSTAPENYVCKRLSQRSNLPMLHVPSGRFQMCKIAFILSIFQTLLLVRIEGMAMVKKAQVMNHDSELFKENMKDLKSAMLQHMGLDSLPIFSSKDLENIEVPHHIRSKYEKLRLRHDIQHARRKRSTGPSLAGVFHSVHQNPGIQGDIVYTDPYREKLEFEMEGRIPTGTVVTMAELRLFKKLPNLSGNLPTDSSADRLYRNAHPSTFLRNHPGRYQKPVRHARVSIYHSLKHPDGTQTSTLVDSRKIHVNGSGWQAFDVTDAVHEWQLHPTKIMSMTLEMWIEGTKPGRHAANIASLVRFTGQKVDRSSSYRPELVVFTEEAETGGSRICKQNSNPKKRKCCRDDYYINFREMDWTQYWILEPSGYEAFKCDGRCGSSLRRDRKGVPRSCSVQESAPLPVMYMVKRGDITQVEVSEFPNMIVKRCGCSLDSVFFA